SSAMAPVRARGSLVLMVLADVDVLEHGDGVLGQHGGGAVERDQVRGRAPLVDPHQAYGQARGDLAGDPGPEEADHTALLVAGADQQDVRLSALDLQLVARDEGEPPPREERRPEQAHGRRRDAAEGALAPEGGDGQRVGEEEARLLPDTDEEV